MKTRFRTSSLIFYGICILVFVISLISFIKAISWIDRPFPGFLIYKFPRVGSMGSTDWPGGKAGLRLMDKIIAVNGSPIRNGQDVVDIAGGKSPGTLVHYTVESGGQIRKLSVPITKFSTIDFLIVFFLPFLGGLALLSIGFIVYILKPNVSTSWVFFFFCLVVSIYMVTGFEMQSTYLFVPLHYFVIPFQGAILFHLGSIFPEKKRFTLRHPILQYGVYLPALILAIFFELQLFTLMRTSSSHALSWAPNVKTVTAFTRIFILFGVVGFIILVLHSMFKTSSNVVRLRAKMIFFGVTLAFFPTVSVFLFVHFIEISFPFNFMIFFVLFFPASMAYSIVRHNLFDADTIIRRSVGYAIVTAIVIGAYALVSISFNVLLGQYQIAQSGAFPIVFTLAIILIFNPLRNRIQSLVDRIFFRKEYDFGEIVNRIGDTITSSLDLGHILKQIMKTFTGDMFIDTSSVMLLSPAKTEYQVYLAEGERKTEVEQIILSRDKPLMQVIEKEKKELTKYDILEDPKYRDICEDCSKDFEFLHASLIVPLIFRDEVRGLISLGEKKSGKFYNREDIDFLHTLARQGAVAFENAKLAEQIKTEETVRANLARYLSPQIVDQVIKKDLQMNLGGDRKVVTILFSDIRNFTRITETLPPDQLVQLLNEYFTEMAKVIFKHQGSLDKYIGDAIVAVFGSLIPLQNSSKTSVQCAIEMMKRMVILNETWKKQYGFTMEMGIGINTGEVFLGNVGSPERMEFTVIGDAVNIASRFSGLALGGQILITKETLNGLGSDIQYKELPPIGVKGKTEKIEVFEITYN